MIAIFRLNFLREQLWYWTYSLNLLIAFDGWRPFWAVGHFWSLAVEEQFYLIWPLVVYFCSKRAFVGVCLACILISVCVRVVLHLMGNSVAAYTLMPARLDSLAIGGLIALGSREPNNVALIARLAMLVASAAAIGPIVLLGLQAGVEADRIRRPAVGVRI